MTALQVRVEVPERGVVIDETFDGAGVSALVGPNGAGKSTVLEVVAGLLRPHRCHVVLGDRVLVDTDAGTWLPPHRRRVALLGQDPLAFPHLDVRGNVAFGLRAQGIPRREAGVRADEWLERLDIAHLARRRGSELSGGQAQRVALARALAVQPDLLLLDEPLSALDVEVAADVRHVLRDLLHGSATRVLLVTHDLLDVVSLAHDVTVVEAGRVTERGPAVELLDAPRSPFAARFVGRNLLRGVVIAPGQVRLPDGLVVHGRGDLPVGAEAVALCDPADVAVHVGPVTGSPRTVIPALVTELATHAGTVRLWARTPSGVRVGADVTALACAELGLRPGSPVTLAVKAQAVRILPAP